MKALFVQMDCPNATHPEVLEATLDNKKIADQDSKAHSAILLSLSDGVLREVMEKASALSLWKKFESLYLKKSLANGLYFKKLL